jgi:hypothetical protein
MDTLLRELGYYNDPANAEGIARDLHRVYRYRTGDPEWEALPPEERETRIANVRHYLEAHRAYRPHLWTGFPPDTHCVWCGVERAAMTTGRCPRA